MVHARLDHVVIAVADLDEACERWGVAGLPAEPGGRHPAGTVNALVRGPGDAYVELISAPGSESNPWVNRVRDSGGGFLSWAIAVDDIHAAHSAIVEAGFTPQRIVDGSRRTPEGDEIGWLMCDLGPGPFDPDLPFLIQWTSPMIPGPQDGPVLDHLSVTPKDPDRLAELLTALGFVGDVTWPRRVFRAPGASAAGIVIQPLGGPVLADGAWAVACVADSDEPSTVPATLTLRVPVERSSNLELDGVGLSVFGDRRRFAGAALLPIVEVVTESLRGGLTGWPSPRLDGSPPTESEYSRVSRPGRHALVGIRAEAWVAVLVEAGYATSADVDSSAALPDSRVALSRATRLTPSEPGGQPLTIGWGGADVPGSVLVIAVGKPPVILDVLPDCACDACDSGSADLIEAIDAAFLLVVSGGVYQVEHAPTRTVVTRTLDGWSAEGDLDSGRIERLLGDTEMGRVTDGVLRGAAWL
ncbi:VOC family protein [Yimella sp. RIT 621]|uniref:DUF6226 family protein n=1 Tax=Yimella sp. RIT 621 TaxID=2510323 RepID=UPI00101C54F7|nr:DUF6226 family protein [Yimella sp. RIT 621]RYG76265.1 VOC family protein [Yimella sp. RIT 621]